MRIKNFIINSKNPFIVAEISGNHKGDYILLKKTINAAIKSGANAVKLQSYTPDDLTLNSKKDDFIVTGANNQWNKKNLYNLYKKGQTTHDLLKKIFEYCKVKNILCFASPFSISSVKELEKLKCPIYKIASLEITNIPLLKEVSKTNKPVIISTGGSNLNEIKSALNIFKYNKNVALLKCTVSYPANLSELNLFTIYDLKKKFKNIEIGYSDHTIGNVAAISAVTLGASIIEKHFILNRKIKSIDNFFSIDPKELKSLVEDCHYAARSLGKIFYGPTKSEINSIKYRRSIYVSKNIDKGKKISKKNIKIVRPGYGLDLKYFEKIIGKVVKKNLKIGDRIKLKDLSNR